MYRAIFEELSNNKINNLLSAPYWIYKIENLIVNNKRYLKIFLFNRIFNNNDINEISFTFNKTEYIIKKFNMVSEYNDKNIVGCLQEIKIDENSVEVSINYEVVGGVKYEQDGISVVYTINNQLKRDDLDFFKKKYENVVVLPSVEKNYYQCICGRIMSIQDNKCLCGKSIDTIKRAFDNIHTIKDERIESNYNFACTTINNAKTILEFQKAIDILKINEDYKDSKEKINNCERNIQELKVIELVEEAKRSKDDNLVKKHIKLIEEQSYNFDVKEYVNELENHLKDIDKKKSISKKKKIITVIAILVFVVVVAITISINMQRKRNIVLEKYNNKDYINAYLFYNDANVNDKQLACDIGKSLFSMGEYDKAYDILKDIKDDNNDIDNIKMKCVGLLAYENVAESKDFIYNFEESKSKDFIYNFKNYCKNQGFDVFEDNELYKDIVYNTIIHCLECNYDHLDLVYFRLYDELDDSELQTKCQNKILDYLNSDTADKAISDELLNEIILSDLEDYPKNKMIETCRNRYGDEEIKIVSNNTTYKVDDSYLDLNELSIYLEFEGELNCPPTAGAPFVIYKAYIYVEDSASEFISSKRELHSYYSEENKNILECSMFFDDDEIFPNKSYKIELWNDLTNTLIYSGYIYTTSIHYKAV